MKYYYEHDTLARVFESLQHTENEHFFWMIPPFVLLFLIVAHCILSHQVPHIYKCQGTYVSVSFILLHIYIASWLLWP